MPLRHSVESCEGSCHDVLSNVRDVTPCPSLLSAVDTMRHCNQGTKVNTHCCCMTWKLQLQHLKLQWLALCGNSPNIHAQPCSAQEEEGDMVLGHACKQESLRCHFASQSANWHVNILHNHRV